MQKPLDEGRRTARRCGAWLTLVAVSAGAVVAATAQGRPPGRVSLGGEEATLPASAGLWDPSAHRVSILLLAQPLPPDVEARARRAGAWPTDGIGPALLVDIDFEAASTMGLVNEIRACRVQFVGFKARLTLSGPPADCHLGSTGGVLRAGGALSAWLDGKGATYSVRVPIAVALLEPPPTTTSRAAEPRAAEPTPAAQSVSYDYRVAVATGESSRSADIAASLERNVNRFAHGGYEVATFLEGPPALIDELLARQPGGDAVVGDRGQAFVIMKRAPGGSIRRDYKLLHLRLATFGFDTALAPINAEGYVLTAFAHDGTMFHAAFERRPGTPPVEYRVYVNKGRRSWMDQVREDATALGRLRRVVPMGLDFALVALGAEASPPGALEWASTPVHRSSTIEDTLKAKAPAGFRVQLVRLRRNELDVLLVRPAGATGPAPAYDVDDGPWGGPCSSGRIVGAAGHSDGDVYCVAEDPRGGISNRGFDAVLRVPEGGTAVMFDETPSCVDRARLSSPRAARARIAAASQLERLLNKKVERGYGLERLLVVREEGRDTRLVGFASNARRDAVPGLPADPGTPELEPEVDGYLDDMTRRRQREMSERFARETGSTDVWLDVLEPAGQKSVVLSGCVRTRAEKERVERAARILLSRPPFTSHQLRSNVLVDFFK